MYIKITDDGRAITTQTAWEKDYQFANMPLLHENALEAATDFMEKHPAFRSVIFCTEVINDAYDLDHLMGSDDDVRG